MSEPLQHSASSERAGPLPSERYRLVRRIGGGATAEVLLAQDLAQGGALRAIKILRGELSAEMRATLRSEFRILASLEHPGIARVYEFGELGDGRAYYTAEYVEGEELGAGAARSWRETSVAMASVCRALAYVHARGYVHNDVKPANIRLQSPETARLLDFGLAGVTREGSRVVSGTPGYIAPERLAGLGWDARADLYAVGATLYRVLGGRRVVQEEEPARALAELRAGAPSLSVLRPELPGALSELVEQLLSLEPSGRPRHAFEVIARLGKALGEALPLETPGAARCYALSSLFVGRESELGDVEQCLREAASPSGKRRVVAVSAGDGMGKSRMLREVSWRAETSGWRVASTQCAEREGALEPLVRLLAQLGSALAAGALEAEGLLEALRAAAGSRPTLLVLDDAHRASEAAWRAAFALARPGAAPGSTMVSMLGFDPESLSATSRQRVAFASASGEALRVELGALTRGEQQRLLDSLFGEGVVSERVHESIAQRSGGSPLLLEEIVRTTVETGVIRSTPSGWSAGEPTTGPTQPSPRLEEFLRRRCAALPAVARSALASLVALGGHASPEALAAIGGVDADAGYGAAVLADRGLVTMRSGEIALEHGLLMSLGLEALEPEERRTLHRKAARWLSEHGADDAELARAYLEAGDAASAFEHAERGGMRAKDMGEGARARDLLEEAVGVASDAGAPAGRLQEVLVACGLAYQMVDRAADAFELLVRAFELSPPPDRARVATLAARMAIFAARADDAAAWIERARMALRPADHLGSAFLALAEGNYVGTRREPSAARAHFRRGLSELEQESFDGPEVHALRARLLSGLGVAEGHFDIAIQAEVRAAAVRAAVASGDRSLLGSMRANVADNLIRGGDARKARELLEELYRENERLGNVHNVLYVTTNLIEACHHCGEWALAHEHLRRLAEAAEGSLQFVPAVLHGIAAECAWREGDFERTGTEARDALASDGQLANDYRMPALIEAVAAAAEGGDRTAASQLALRAEADAREADAPFERAQAAAARAYCVSAASPTRGGEALRDAAGAFAEMGFLRDVPVLLRDAARAYARAGDMASARSCVEQARPLLEANGNAPALEALQRVLAPSERAFDLSVARTVEELGRMLPAVASALGLGSEVQLTTTQAAQPGRQSIAVGAGAWLQVGADADARCVSLLALAVRTALSALERSRSGPREGGTQGRADEDSRHLELTIGPVELRHGFEGIIGRSRAMTRALAVLDRLADSDAPLLLTGETGTGKEVFARALHGASARAQKPFVGVNCSAVPAPLFEAELFGYRRGAFTGAVRDHPGLAREADGGTLFLDEVGDLPLEIQPKLLRLLQDGRVRAVGGDRESEVDIRLVAATNRDLGADVAAGRFRADLFYRINVVEIRLPALRERLPDIAELARHLLERMGRAHTTLPPKTLRRLLDYPWPGNVRELENELQRASILAGPAGPIEERHLSPKIRQRGRDLAMPRGTLTERLEAAERQILLDALKLAKSNRTHAAKALGLTRGGLVRKLKRLGLQTGPKGIS